MSRNSLSPFSARTLKARRIRPQSRPRLLALEDRLAPAAGLLDPTFGVGGLVTTHVPGPSGDGGGPTAVDSLGRIVVAGSTYGGLALARYTSAGVLDPSFGGTGVVTFDFDGSFASVTAVAVDSLDRVVVAGNRFDGSIIDFAVARLTAAGALDSSFDGDGKQTIAFGASGDYATGVAVDSLDRVVVAGATGPNGSPRAFSVVRLTAAGALDSSFDGDGIQTFAFGVSFAYAYDVAVDSLDRVVVAGDTHNGSNFDFAVARLTAAGALDSSFDGDGKQTVAFGGSDTAYDVAVDSLGRVVVAGRTNSDLAVARLTAAGALDSSFDGDGKQTIAFGVFFGTAYDVAVDSLDRVVVASTTYNGSNGDFAVARLTAAGALDSSFDGDGKQTVDFGGPDDTAYGVAVDSLNRVVVAGTTDNGSNSDFAVARLTAAGALDSSFDGDGKQTLGLTAGSGASGTSVAVDSLGRTVVAGYTSIGIAVTRYTPAGALDPSFGGTGVVTFGFRVSYNYAFGVAVDSLDRVVVAGYTYNGTNWDFAVARLTAGGALDSSFDGDGKQTIDFGASSDQANGVAVDSLDRVVVAGYTENGSNRDFAVARLTAAGALDSSFDGDGKQTIDFGASSDGAEGVAVDSLDRVVLAGYKNSDFAVARLTAAGALDSSFDDDGKQTVAFGGFNTAKGVAVDSLGRVVVAGETISGSTVDCAVARLTAAGALDTGFDGDGKQTFAFGASHEYANGVAVDSLDRVVVAGYENIGEGTIVDFAVARLTPAGALDSSFDGDGKQTIDFGGSDDAAFGMAIDSAGRVVLAGESISNVQVFAVARLTGDTTVASAQVNDGAAQRSRVTNLTIRFSGQIVFSGLVADAFTLVRTGGGAVNFIANVSVAYGGTVVTFSNFTGPETEFASLRDGRYTLTALASQISSGGIALDGDGDGIVGGNSVTALHRFYGDMNGDRRVDISDFGFFSLAYLTQANYNAALDFNADGRIDIADFGQFSVRYFTTLP